jgi:hypothetical protein
MDLRKENLLGEELGTIAEICEERPYARTETWEAILSNESVTVAKPYQISQSVLMKDERS